LSSGARPRTWSARARAGGLHARSIEVLDQRGIAGRFLSEGQLMQVAGFAHIRLDISDFPSRHNYVLALWQRHIRTDMSPGSETKAASAFRRR
jgi:hypothetical protein